MKTVKTCLRYFEEGVCAILLIIMLGVSTLNIITRYLPGISFASSEELVVNLFVWFTMIGAVIAIKHKSHLSITFIIRKIPERYLTPFLLIRWSAVCIVFSLLSIYGIIETWEEFKIGMMTYSLGWPLWFFTCALPIGSLLLLFRFSQITLKELKTRK